MAVLENPQKWLNLDLYVSDMSWIMTNISFSFKRACRKQKTIQYSTINIPYAQIDDMPETLISKTIQNFLKMI